MTGLRKRDGDSEGDSGFVTPDSTTREKVSRFCEGEDVLSHGKDGIFYLGTVVVIDAENDRCLVQFEDNTAHWSLYKDITKLRLPESDELCVICKSSRSWSCNEIVLCYICDQGYHQNCLQPSIGKEYCEPDSEWECPRCVCQPVLQKEEKKKSKESSPRKQRPRQQVLVEEDDFKQQALPYEISSLNWDIGHKSNKEQTYCYCGGPGEWYNRMLQCQRCKQWFHEACVECLHSPLLYGDRFYVFVCNLCNEGCEFLHRLDVKWLDVVHLATFNLTLQDSKMYFEYDSGITQWINDNWELLQCPVGLQSLRVNERKHEILRILENNRFRFKCGKESKKKASLWGLRVRVPPPVPIVTLPTKEVISEQSIKHIVLRHKKSSNTSPPVPRSYKFREEKHDEIEDMLTRYSPAKKRPTSPSIHFSQDEDEEMDDEEEEKAAEDMGANKRKRKRELEILIEDKKAKKMIEEVGSTNNNKLVVPNIKSTNDNSDTHDEPSNEVKRKRGRPPKRQDGERPTKPLRHIYHRKSHNTQKDSLKETKENFVDLKPPEGLIPPISGTPPGDTSGDDTSSHGTLESFIPPPSNFEGQNNPFLHLDSLSYGMPVVRPLKRKLNENDIKIGKNGEVKRRRFRRKLDKAKYLYMVQTGGVLPIQGHNVIRINGAASIRNCVDYALNGRLLAKTESGEMGVGKDENGYCLSDLQSTVNTYFGAANRIANGEKFHILAKRTSIEDKVQFLIEWDTPNSS